VAVTEIKLTQVAIPAAGDPCGARRSAGAKTLMLTATATSSTSASMCSGRSMPPSRQFRVQLKNPEETVRAVAESAMREVVGKRELQPIINDRVRRSRMHRR